MADAPSRSWPAAVLWDMDGADSAFGPIGVR